MVGISKIIDPRPKIEKKENADKKTEATRFNKLFTLSILVVILTIAGLFLPVQDNDLNDRIYELEVKQQLFFQSKDTMSSNLRDLERQVKILEHSLQSIGKDTLK